MEVIGLAFAIPGLLDVLLKTAYYGYQTILDTRDAPDAIMNYIQKFAIEHQRFQDWEKRTRMAIGPMPVARRGDGGPASDNERRYRLIAVTLGFITQAFDEVARQDGKYGQVGAAQCSTATPIKETMVRGRWKKHLPWRKGPSVATQPSPSKGKKGAPTPSQQPVSSLSELTITSELEYLNQHAMEYQVSVPMLSSMKWAAIGKNTMENLYQKVKGYNDDLETLTGPLVEMSQINAKLPCVAEAAFDSYSNQHKRRCHEGTRVELLERIHHWSRDATGPCIYWLNGVAGSGKSTVAKSIAYQCQQERRLASSFFFSRGQGDQGNATKFFTTLSVQLCRAVPAVRSHVLNAIHEDDSLPNQGLQQQWKHLIFQPLSRSLEAREITLEAPLVIVIDALDECEDERDVRLILQLLSKAQVMGADQLRLRVFITSRPETPIRLGFRKNLQDEHVAFILHEVPPSTIQEDITKFLRHELEEIRKDAEEEIQVGWPGDERISSLCQRSQGLFIYAATACRFVADDLCNPDAQLTTILQHDYVGQSPTKQLDEMYTTILQQSLAHREFNEKEECELFRHVVGSIVILQESLSTETLESLLYIPAGKARSTLNRLHSLLDVPKDEKCPVKLQHPSFRDYLLDGERCRDPRFRVNMREAHRKSFNSCLDVMSKYLKMDICNLNRPGVLRSEVDDETIDRCIPEELRYACRYWVYHFERSGPDAHDMANLQQFLESYFLHWLEALSFLRIASEGLQMIITLESVLTKHPPGKCMTTKQLETTTDLVVKDKSDDSSYISDLVYDAKRFILKNRWIIENAPLQVYYSAIIFSPTNSRIRTCFSRFIPSWITKLPPVGYNWDSSLQILEGHSKVVRAIAFSPDGSLLASASDDTIVRLWDTATGAPRGVLEGHSDWVVSVTFSPDGSLLASASRDTTVRFWGTATGVPRGVLKGHSALVFNVTFSPDGSLLASASHDTTVRLWDTATGVPRGILEGHSSMVFSVTFSPDGSLLASASNDTVRLWDTVTGAPRGVLEGHSDWILSVTFSPDGSLLAPAFDDNTVRLWDMVTGAPQGVIEGHSDWFISVTFSPDGSLLASASNGTVRLWDTTTGAPRGVLKGHSGGVLSVAFSPDGSLLASASDDTTVRLWDTATGAPHGVLKGHSDWVVNVTFSPDGSLLASASHDATVQLWDLKVAGNPRGTRSGHSNRVSSVAFSPDRVVSVTFSPDGSLLASVSGDNTVQLWDTVTGAPRGVLKGHSTLVFNVTFSPDGSLLAFASDDNTVRLWDTVTGAPRGVLKGHSGGVLSVAFSPDGSLLASASHDNTVRLWDTATGAPHGVLEGHSSWVRAIAFSPDGSLLASASNDTVRLWDTATGTLMKLFRVTRLIDRVSFSRCGNFLNTYFEIINLDFEGRDRDESISPYIWGLDQEWICYNGQKLLRVPVDYRPPPRGPRCIFDYVDAYENCVAVGSGTRLVWMIRFDPEKLPLYSWNG